MRVFEVDHFFVENLVDRCCEVLFCHWEDSLAIPVIIFMLLKYDRLRRDCEQGLIDLLETEDFVCSLQKRGPELMLDQHSR